MAQDDPEMSLPLNVKKQARFQLQGMASAPKLPHPPKYKKRVRFQDVDAAQEASNPLTELHHPRDLEQLEKTFRSLEAAIEDYLMKRHHLQVLGQYEEALRSLEAALEDFQVQNADTAEAAPLSAKKQPHLQATDSAQKTACFPQKQVLFEEMDPAMGIPCPLKIRKGQLQATDSSQELPGLWTRYPYADSDSDEEAPHSPKKNC